MYDRYRPESPDELIDELTAGNPTRGLDVGCGTGKVARTLARRGLAVLGIEVDERMADVARGHGVEVEVAPFETWDDAGRRFDLITCGDAWHWIDPEAGIAKAARVLATGGIMAWFWNSSQVEEPVASAFTRVYRSTRRRSSGSGGHGRRPVPNVCGTSDDHESGGERVCLDCLGSGRAEGNGT
ncbi:class I SAM-dependent methyltransferase [Microtetraspora sp. NBRC 16547]|uniref:class I SAM-dependent methyltransferase n=1 Tax=Microtetraspora sp. NBRC 16547 TaxID=3030993 RepID=UPI0024A6008C|nr:class I SAM-dependent methyltransferase [Microtetraspora sp. NBRC 16547]GLW97019.1 hypothetical protein Misp02_11060 [Microtetraspora sp. NBRC 16547]